MYSLSCSILVGLTMRDLYLSSLNTREVKINTAVYNPTLVGMLETEHYNFVGSQHCYCCVFTFFLYRIHIWTVEDCSCSIYSNHFPVAAVVPNIEYRNYYNIINVIGSSSTRQLNHWKSLLIVIENQNGAIQHQYNQQMEPAYSCQCILQHTMTRFR